MNRKAVSGMMVTLLLIGMLTLAFNIPPIRAEPRIWTVDDDEPADFSSIQEAINSPIVKDGDTIFVRNGTYYENVVLNKSLKLIGENREAATIDGAGTGTVVHVTADNVTVSGFTIRRGGNGIYLYHSSGSTVSGNIAANNSLGIFIGWSSGITVSGNKIVDNGYVQLPMFFEGGMRVMDSGDSVFRDNNMTGNRHSFGVWGYHLSDYIQDVDTSNTVDGKPIYYLINQSNLLIDSYAFPNIGYLGLINSTRTTIKDLTLTNNGEGVLFAYVTNSTIESVNVSNNVDGIYLWDSHNIIISENNSTNNFNGIMVYESSGNRLSGNTVANNDGQGIWIYESNDNIISDNNSTNNHSESIMLDYSHSNIITGNTVTDSGYGIYLQRSDYNIVSGNTVKNSGGGIGANSAHNTISGNTVTYNNGFGIFLNYDASTVITENTVTNNGHGIHLTSSSNITISRNNIANNWYSYGIVLSESTGNNLNGNNITNNNMYGVYLSESDYNYVIGNNIANNTGGIRLLMYSSSNVISGNNLTNNGIGHHGCHGFSISSSCVYNVIYHNSFIHNTKQVVSYNSTNTWDDDYPSGGNYWSDYEERYPNAMELDDSGIWDTPYEIDDYNQDNYPLMEPWAPTPSIPTTIGELKTEIEESGSEGEIGNKGIVKSLIAKLNVAQRLVDKGKTDQAKHILGKAFIQQVQNLSGIHITPAAADILIESAEYIISHL